MAQLVAHHTGSVGVTGSSPVSSTTFTRFSSQRAGIFHFSREQTGPWSCA